MFYSCKISTDSASRGPSAIAEPLVFFIGAPCISQETTTKEQVGSRERVLSETAGTGVETPRPSSSTSAAEQELIERKVCWDLRQRGNVGETALHLALLLSKQAKFRQIAVALLNAFPLLCLDYYEDDEYYGRLIHYSALTTSNSVARPYFRGPRGPGP